MKVWPVLAAVRTKGREKKGEDTKGPLEKAFHHEGTKFLFVSISP